MIQSFDLSGKTIALTGGYGHLGKVVAEYLVSHNAKVCVLGLNKRKFDQVFEKMENIGFIECDVSQSFSIKKAFKTVVEKHKKIDVLINNAFYSKGQSPDFLTDEEWEYSIQGTLSSVFKCTREIIPYLKKQKTGKIINVSSMYGMIAPQFEIYSDFPEFINPPHYGASKAGIIQLTKYYASYLGKHNITVNTITPGPFPSNQVQQKQKFVKELALKTCLNRVGSPYDLGGAFVFLSSDASNFITGQNIVIDGGWTIK